MAPQVVSEPDFYYTTTTLASSMVPSTLECKFANLLLCTCSISPSPDFYGCGTNDPLFSYLIHSSVSKGLPNKRLQLWNAQRSIAQLCIIRL